MSSGSGRRGIASGLGRGMANAAMKGPSLLRQPPSDIGCCSAAPDRT
ncbi:hypothetical protein VB777_15100 [Synechococcus sp. CCY9202]|nr:hypothetical protein [Synechococcus sp. CCY9202]